jgi:hypothetical protein
VLALGGLFISGSQGRAYSRLGRPARYMGGRSGSKAVGEARRALAAQPVSHTANARKIRMRLSAVSLHSFLKVSTLPVRLVERERIAKLEAETARAAA